MEELVLSGRLIDIILVLVALEAVVFLVLYRLLSAAPRLARPHRAVLWPTLLSGALLMLAVRLAVTQVPWTLLVTVLAGAGLAHMLDLALRFRAG